MTVSSLDSRFSIFMATVRRIVGMPDYQAYVAHLREAHPGCAIPSEREYFSDYLRRRYDGGASRCC